MNVAAEAWAGLIGVAIGSVLSIIGIWITNRANLRHLQVQLQHEQDDRLSRISRDRLEELYTLVGAWLNLIAGKYLSVSMVMQGKLSYNDHYDLFIKGGEQSNYDFNRIEMIIDVYGSNLQEVYSVVIKSRSELNEIERRFKKDYELGRTNGEKYLTPYVSKQYEIEKNGRELKAAIAEQTKSA